MFPVPCAETAIPSAGAVPSFNVKSPPSVRSTIEPFPETVRTSDNTASANAVTDPSSFTRFTFDATPSTAKSPRFKILIPPPPARTATEPTCVSTALANSPKTPTPIPATKRNRSAATFSDISGALFKIDPLVAVTEIVVPPP